MSQMPSRVAKMLIFHRNLGCNDDDATIDERSERILYYYSSSDCQHCVDNCDNKNSEEHSQGECNRAYTNREGDRAYTNREGGSKGGLSGSTHTKNSADNHSSAGFLPLTEIAKVDQADNRIQLQLLHMLESLIEFSAKFCRDKVDFILCQKNVWSLSEFETNVWIAVAVPLSEEKNKYSRNDIQILMRDMYSVFVTTHGTFDSILSSYLFSSLSTPSVSPRNYNISVCIDNPSDDGYDDTDSNDNRTSNDKSKSKSNSSNNDINDAIKILKDEKNKDDLFSNKAKLQGNNFNKIDDRRSGWELINDVKVLRKRIRKLKLEKDALNFDLGDLKKRKECENCENKIPVEVLRISITKICSDSDSISSNKSVNTRNINIADYNGNCVTNNNNMMVGDEENTVVEDVHQLDLLYDNIVVNNDCNDFINDLINQKELNDVNDNARNIEISATDNTSINKDFSNSNSGDYKNNDRNNDDDNSNNNKDNNNNKNDNSTNDLNNNDNGSNNNNDNEIKKEYNNDNSNNDNNNNNNNNRGNNNENNKNENLLDSISQSNEINGKILKKVKYVTNFDRRDNIDRLSEINSLEDKLFFLCEEIEFEEKRLQTFLCFENTSKSYHNNYSKIIDINDKTVINDYCSSKIKNEGKMNIPELQLNAKPFYVYTPFVLQNFLLHFFSWYDFDNFQFLDSSDNNDERQRILCTDNNNDFHNINHEKKNNFEENCTSVTNNDVKTHLDFGNNFKKNDQMDDIDHNCNIITNSIKTKKIRKIYTYVDENLKNTKSLEKNKNLQFSSPKSPKSPFQRIFNYFK